MTRRFEHLSVAAGLPVITLDMGRHAAATLDLEAGLDVKIVSDQFGHANASFTRNT